MIMKWLSRIFRGSRSSSRKAAAFHEAGHVVAAIHSKYHSIVGSISIEDYGAGEAFVCVSKRKCLAAGKQASQTDPDLVRDFAVILKAGLAAEMIAERTDTSVFSDPRASNADDALLEQQLRSAGIAPTPDVFLASARELLELHWEQVDALAKQLDLGPVDAADILFQ
jgi:hypothetical protein